MKNSKNIFRICLMVFSIAIIGAVANSVINYDSVVLTFQDLGYPKYLIHLLGAAQIIGLILIIVNKDVLLVEWVYAGFFMNFALGCIAHLASNSGSGASAVVCLIILLVTYVQAKKVREVKKQNTPVEESNLAFETSVQ